ncbi:MAG: hypothetical protein MJ088_02190 [Clostridia bacterium]|nr:hypothetical protein [Clostridia bacterium]
MECRNELCIYQQRGKCLLDEITVNEAGDCESCIMVSLPEKTLARRKKEMRDRLDED